MHLSLRIILRTSILLKQTTTKQTTPQIKAMKVGGITPKRFEANGFFPYKERNQVNADAFWYPQIVIQMKCSRARILCLHQSTLPFSALVTRFEMLFTPHGFYSEGLECSLVLMILTPV